MIVHYQKDNQLMITVPGTGVKNFQGLTMQQPWSWRGVTWLNLIFKLLMGMLKYQSIVNRSQA